MSPFPSQLRQTEPQLHGPDPNINQVSPSSTNMIVTNTPAADLTLTNLAYCSHADLHGFAVPDTKLYLASIADSFVLSLSYPFLSFLTAPYFALKFCSIVHISNSDQP